MTGVSAFLLFSQAHNHHNQGRTLIMSQSFTSMDARTQEEINKQLEAEKKSKILIEQWWKQDKDVPTYPEPEGDPSY